MPAPRRVWDSCIVLGYLSGYDDLKPDCDQIIDQAQRGELEIVVSAFASVEAAYLQGHSDDDSEAKIREFFGRNYVIVAAIDISTAAIARGLIRKYRHTYRITPPDAAHLALAIQLHIPVLETTDLDLIQLSEKEGNPQIVIRKPLYEGPQRLPGV